MDLLQSKLLCRENVVSDTLRNPKPRLRPPSRRERLTRLCRPYLLLILGFGRQPAQDEFLCQIGGRSLAGSNKEIP